MKIIENIKTNKFIKLPLLVLAVVLGLAALLTGIGAVYAKVYQNKVYPGVYVGNYHIGGMTKDAVKDFAEQLNNRLAREGFEFTVFDKNGAPHQVKIGNLLSAGESVIELANIDSVRLGNEAYKVGRFGDWLGNLFSPLALVFEDKKISAPLNIDKQAFVEILNQNFSGFADQPHNANIKVNNLSPLAYEIVPEKAGKDYNYEQVYSEITGNLSAFVFDTFTVSPRDILPDIKAGELDALIPKLDTVLSYGNLSLNYVDPQTNWRKDWAIESQDYSQWLQAARAEEGLYFKLNDEQVAEFLKVPKSYINRLAQDAKFEMADGRVVKFQASRPGVKMDLEKTIEALNTAFKERNYQSDKVSKTVSAVFDIVEPNVKLSDVNELGISDIIGFGVSTFKDSHTNRIKNIGNAVKRLNGVLIKPDEIFSTNKYAGPYIEENGFLPEVIIKGDEIKNEVGGGMCQIGTTMFRAAMNAGMDITQRRNHSLVVSYYADPVNGNPGTDATLYEPYLDLKFKNDTGNYMLLQTEIDYDRQELKFTLWGKPDGRKGWYTHPEVLKWIPAGEPQEIETTDLAPGKKECQAAFTGAAAKFTYSRITPAGEKIDRVFESNYRPLPKICLIGIEATSTPAASGAEVIIEEPVAVTTTNN